MRAIIILCAQFLLLLATLVLVCLCESTCLCVVQRLLDHKLSKLSNCLFVCAPAQVRASMQGPSRNLRKSTGPCTDVPGVACNDRSKHTEDGWRRHLRGAIHDLCILCAESECSSPFARVRP